MGILIPSTYLYALAPAPEDKIKAAYIFQFTKFIEWPDDNQAKSNQTFTICIVGNDSITTQLQPLNNRRVENRSIIIKTLNEKDNPVGCEILYIGKSVKSKLDKIIKLIQFQPMLTVSSIPEFAHHGGMINFVISDNKVRLEINLNSTREADLKISAKLLEISLNVIKHSSGGADL